MDLKEYIERMKEDTNAFWRLEPGETQNLLDEAIEKLEIPSIEEDKKVIISLLKCAETEAQRETASVIIELFKNKHKKNPKLLIHVWEIQSSFYKITSKLL